MHRDRFLLAVIEAAQRREARSARTRTPPTRILDGVVMGAARVIRRACDEVAHALSSTVDGDSEAHGPDYVGLYMGLLDRRLRIPMPLLMFTATQHGLAFNLAAKPRFQQP
jgi:hypothetical protein